MIINPAIGNVLSPATTGNIASLPLPPGNGPLTIRMDNPSLSTIQGIKPGLAGQHLTILPVNVGQVDLAYNDAAAAAGEKIITNVTIGKTSMSTGGAVELVYETSSRWILKKHEQGAMIGRANTAGDFTASAGIWTVDPGDFSTFAFYLNGKMLTVYFNVSTTTLSAAAVVAILIPNGYQSAAQMYFPGRARCSDNGTVLSGMVGVGAANTIINVWKDIFGTSFALQTNTLGIQFKETFAVL